MRGTESEIRRRASGQGAALGQMFALRARGHADGGAPAAAPRAAREAAPRVPAAAPRGGRESVPAPRRPVTLASCMARGVVEQIERFPKSHHATRAPVGVHTTPWRFTPYTQRQRSRALTHTEGLASSCSPHGATRGQEGDAAVHVADARSSRRFEAHLPCLGFAARAPRVRGALSL